MRSILVPVDGSRFADSALPVAVRLANEHGARLRLVTVHEPVLPIVPAAEVPIATAATEDPSVREQIAALLEDSAKRIGTAGGQPVAYRVLDGMAGQALTEHLVAEPPDLVVMSTHGRGPVSRFWLGSVADYLVRHVSVPLLLLRPHDPDAVPVDVPLERAIVPLDLSPESEAILEPLLGILPATESITLIYVVEPALGISGGLPPYPLTAPPDLVSITRQSAERRLGEVAERLRASGRDVVTRVVVGLGVAATVLEQAEQANAHVVAITTHGAGGVKRLLIGSVADKLIRASTRPVLVYRPPPRDEQGR